MAEFVRCANYEEHEIAEPIVDPNICPEPCFWLVEDYMAYQLGWRRDGSDLLCPVCVKRIQDQSVSHDPIGLDLIRRDMARYGLAI